MFGELIQFYWAFVLILRNYGARLWSLNKFEAPDLLYKAKLMLHMLNMVCIKIQKENTRIQLRKHLLYKSCLR